MIDPKHFDYMVDLANKKGISWMKMIEHMIAQYQLVEEGIMNLTPNLDHPFNQRLKKGAIQ